MAEPTGGDPFREGLDAYGRGVPREACPYPESMREHEIWLEGWDQAKHYSEDEEVVDNI